MMGWFCMGAVAYPLLELAWRGRTHASMALAGGLSGTVLGQLTRSRRPLWVRALLGGGCVTAIELAVGMIWNRHHRVWDYRRMPLNWRGQICLPYSLVWCGFSALMLGGAALGKKYRR